jgi:hypothetical protein
MVGAVVALFYGVRFCYRTYQIETQSRAVHEAIRQQAAMSASAVHATAMPASGVSGNRPASLSKTWDSHPVTITQTGVWYSVVHLKKGQHYRYTMSGRLVKPDDGMVFGINDVEMNIGTEQEVLDGSSRKHSCNNNNAPIPVTCQEKGSGIAPREGNLWFGFGGYFQYQCKEGIQVIVELDPTEVAKL